MGIPIEQPQLNEICPHSPKIPVFEHPLYSLNMVSREVFAEVIKNKVTLVQGNEIIFRQYIQAQQK
jgi:hypothetical protein